jgi:hypothetical protein
MPRVLALSLDRCRPVTGVGISLLLRSQLGGRACLCLRSCDDQVRQRTLPVVGLICGLYLALVNARLLGAFEKGARSEGRQLRPELGELPCELPCLSCDTCSLDLGRGLGCLLTRQASDTALTLHSHFFDFEINVRLTRIGSVAPPICRLDCDGQLNGAIGMLCKESSWNPLIP